MCRPAVGSALRVWARVCGTAVCTVCDSCWGAGVRVRVWRVLLCCACSWACAFVHRSCRPPPCATPFLCVRTRQPALLSHGCVCVHEAGRWRARVRLRVCVLRLLRHTSSVTCTAACAPPLRPYLLAPVCTSGSRTHVSTPLRWCFLCGWHYCCLVPPPIAAASPQHCCWLYWQCAPAPVCGLAPVPPITGWAPVPVPAPLRAPHARPQ